MGHEVSGLLQGISGISVRSRDVPEGFRSVSWCFIGRSKGFQKASEALQDVSGVIQVVSGNVRCVLPLGFRNVSGCSTRYSFKR